MKNIKAIILAAGEGKRLKKYTNNLPKGMLNFAGKSLIERQIELYRKAGISDISVVKGYAHQKINYNGIKYFINEEYGSTNMLTSLFCAEKELLGEVIISYADIVFGEDLLSKLIKSEADIVVSVDINWKKYWKMRYGRIGFDTESLVLDKNNIITSLGRPAPPIEEIGGRYIGLNKFSPKGIEELKKIWHKFETEFWNKPWQASGLPLGKAYMTDAFQALIDEGYEVNALTTENGWIEFDTDEDYEKAIRWHNDGILGLLVKVG